MAKTVCAKPCRLAEILRFMTITVNRWPFPDLQEAETCKKAHSNMGQCPWRNLSNTQRNDFAFLQPEFKSLVPTLFDPFSLPQVIDNVAFETVQSQSPRNRNGSHRFVLSDAIKDGIPCVNPVAIGAWKKVSQNRRLPSKLQGSSANPTLFAS